MKYNYQDNSSFIPSFFLGGALKQLFFILGASFLVSCSWFQKDPLKGLSPEFFDGVLSAGSENFSPHFDEVLVRKFLKTEVIGQEDLLMTFQEGVEKSYKIQFRFLNDFDKNYEIVIDENPFSLFLKDSQWDYNSDLKIFVLSWKPHPGFNNGVLYKRFNVKFSIKLRKKTVPAKNHVFSVKRQFNVVVHKKSFLTSIKKVSVKEGINTFGKVYTRLDDGNFYRSDGINYLDLSYHDEIFVSNALFIDDSSSQKSSILNYHDIFSKHTLIYPFNVLMDKKENTISLDLIPFIQQPYYYLSDDCEEGFCPTEDRSSVPVATELYVKLYQNPLETEPLYYKVEAPILCKKRYKETASHIVYLKPDSEENYKEECYLALEKFRNSLSELRETDEGNVYLLKDQNLEKLDLSNWPVAFRKIPSSIKWNLSGYKPILNNAIPVQVQHTENILQQKTLIFEIENKNKFYSDDIKLVLDKLPPDFLYWNFPVDWTLKHSKVKSPELMELSYRLFTKSEAYQSASLFVTPFFETIKGESAFIHLSVLPTVKSEQVYEWGEVVLEQIFKESLSKREWVESSLILNQKVQRSYIFSKDLYSNLPLSFSSEVPKMEVLKDNLNLNPIKAQLYHCLTEESCFCSDFSFYQNNDDIYASAQCVYKSLFNFTNEEKPSYIQHNHSIGESYPLIGLKQWSALGDPIKDQSISVIESSYTKESSSTKQIDPDSVFAEGLFHIFFDLKPKVLCTREEAERLNCSIRYLFETPIRKLLYHDKHKEKNLLSQKALQMHCFEKNASNTATACDCQEGELNRVSEMGPGSPSAPAELKATPRASLDFECSFEKGDVEIELFLKTEQTNVFLLNKKDRSLKQTPKHYITIQGVEE